MSNIRFGSPFSWDYSNNGIDEITPISGGGGEGGGVTEDTVNEIVDQKLDTISLNGDELTYTLYVTGNDVGTINIPEDQFLKNVEYDSENKVIIFTMNTDEGEKSVSVSIADLVTPIEDEISDIELQIANFETKDNVNALSARVTVLESNKANVGDSYTKAESDEKYEAKVNLATVATTGNYNDLNNKPTIPSKTSELENDSNFITSHQSLEDYATKTYVGEKIAEVVGDAPETLDTLKEISDALQDNATMTMVSEAISTKANTADVYSKGEMDDKIGDLGTVIDVEGVDATYWEEGDELPDGVSVGDVKTEAVEEVSHERSVKEYVDDSIQTVNEKPEVENIKLKYDALLSVLGFTDTQINNVVVNHALSESNNVTFNGGSVDDIEVPETTKTTTITVELEPESTLTLTSPKGVTVFNTSDEPTNLTIDAPAEGSTPTITLKDGDFATVTLENASLTVSNDGIVQNVIVTSETAKSITISAIFNEGATVTSYSSAPITITNKNAEGKDADIVIDTPNSTVTLSGGKWTVVDATVSDDTLIIKKTATIQDLNVKRGNVVVEVARESDIENVIKGDITFGETCDSWLVVDHTNFADARHNQLEDYYNNYPTEAMQDGETWPPFTPSVFPWLVINHNFDGKTKVEGYYQGELKFEWTPSAMVTREDGTEVNRTYGILSIPDEFDLPQFAETTEGNELQINPEDITIKLISSTITHKIVELNSNTIGNVFKSNLLYDGEYKLTSNVSLAKSLTTGIVSNADVVWNLNGYDYTSTGSNGMFLMRGSSQLEVKGEGTITNNTAYGVWISGGKGVINGGKIVANTHALYCEKGLIEVNDGTFMMANANADKDENGNYRFLLNCLDKNYTAGTANIVVRGGKFYDFDPGNCAAEGPGTSFLAEGYVSVQSTETIDGVEHKVYTVVKA